MNKPIHSDDFRDLSIADFLAKLGYYPVKKSGKELFYHSMLRDTSQNTPSLTVWDEGGKWLDRGGAGSTGIQGGGIIQLGMAYWPNLSFVEVLNQIAKTSGHQLSTEAPNRVGKRKAAEQEASSAFQLDAIKPIGSNYVLTNYLISRGILDVAKNHMMEVYYRTERNRSADSKPFYAVGWANEVGNWEFTTAKGFKSSIGKKGLSVIPGSNNHAALFEGFMDFLSWLKINKPQILPTVIVLNSVVQLQKAIDRIGDIPNIDVYFDNDLVGRRSTQTLLNSVPHAIDRSSEYANYKDYNERLQNDLQDERYQTSRVSYKR